MTIVPMSDSEIPLLGSIVRQNVGALVSDSALKKKLVILDARVITGSGQGSYRHGTCPDGAMTFLATRRHAPGGCISPTSAFLLR